MTLTPSDGLNYVAGLAINELRRRLEDPEECREIPAATLARIVVDVGKLQLAAHDKGGTRVKRTALERVMGLELPRERKIALVSEVAGVTSDEAARMLETPSLGD